MVQVLIDYANDMIEETTDEYKFVTQLTKQETDNLVNTYKRCFSVIFLIFGSIIAFTSSQIIDFSYGAIFFVVTGIITILIFWKRQSALRKLNDAYGLYISVVDKEKSLFRKFKKNIHYWNHNRPFSEKDINNSLEAFTVIGAAYSLYLIEVYENIFPLVGGKMKKKLFIGMLLLIEQSLFEIRTLQETSFKLLPYFIQDELFRMIQDNKKYVSKYFNEPSATTNYEVYVSFSDYVYLMFGNPWEAIKLLGFKKYSQHSQEQRNKEFLLDKNMKLIKSRTKQ